MDQEMSEKNAK